MLIEKDYECVSEIDIEDPNNIPVVLEEEEKIELSIIDTKFDETSLLQMISDEVDKLILKLELKIHECDKKLLELN